MIYLRVRNDDLILDFSQGELSHSHKHQLAYWGFKQVNRHFRFSGNCTILGDTILKITNYLNDNDVRYSLSREVQNLVEEKEKASDEVLSAINAGKDIKDGILNKESYEEFVEFIQKSIKRKLKGHQIKAAFHLLEVINGANFSVPGSGKTTVVLSVFQRLRSLDVVDALFVVGPPASFGPWVNEYKEVLNDALRYEILAGGDIITRHSKYFVTKKSVSDLYLTSFQTLQRDWEKVISFFSLGVRFFLVVDEAHYIKQPDGAWASAVLNIAGYAKRRCVLTGTPFPYSYLDAFNLFDVLWPGISPISEEKKHLIDHKVQNKEFSQASELLDASIGPLFYRVRKHDLNLAPQNFEDPIMVEMKGVERKVYERILDKYREISRKDYFRDLDTLISLRKARMIRLRQCLSYVTLLGTAIPGFSEDPIEDEKSIANLIKNYDRLESPGKLEMLIGMVKDLHASGQRLVIWSNFVKTLKLIKKSVGDLGIRTELIYGDTPFERAGVEDEMTREKIIEDFTSKHGKIDVLVANPAACAESISLHKTCSHAIYYDLSYNCAQYMQSLDRIHRVGGSEKKESFYYFLQYEDTFERDILSRLKDRESRMKQIIDQEYPIYSMDMFSDDDEESKAYERIFKQS